MMHTKRSLIAISVAMLLTACGDENAKFTPLEKTVPEVKAKFQPLGIPTPVIEVIVADTLVVEPTIDEPEPIVINDLPCVITIRGELPDVIKKFENACGITEYRNCEYVDYGTYQCSNQPPKETLALVKPAEPIAEVITETIPALGEIEVEEPEITIQPPMREPTVEIEIEPDTEPLSQVKVPEISMPEPIIEVAVAPPIIVNKPTKKPVIKKQVSAVVKPPVRPIPRPTNVESAQGYVERHDLVIDYDDVASGNVVKYGKLWAHVILNLGGDVWVAGHSDNIAAVAEYIATFYPDINTRSIKVVTTRDPHEATTSTYKTLERYTTLLEVDNEDDIDITIASNSIAAVSHTDGKLIVPDDLYPIGP